MGENANLLQISMLIHLNFLSLFMSVRIYKGLGQRWKKMYEFVKNVCVKNFLARVKSLQNFTLFC